MQYIKDRDEIVIGQEIESFLGSILHESQLEVMMNMLKQPGDEGSGMEHLASKKGFKKEREFKRARLTFQYLMERMGLLSVFKKIMVEYNANKKNKYDDTLLKILYRCSMAYKSIQKIEKIVTMLKKKNELLSIFIKKQSAGQPNATTKEHQAKMEELLAALCLQSQRVYI